MISVTGRIKQIEQPAGGYIMPSEFEKTCLYDSKVLGEENISSSIIGITVDYLTRYMMEMKTNITKNNDEILRKAFEISILGYKEKLKWKGKREEKKDIKNNLDINYLLQNVKGLDDNSIINACKIATYDVWYRNFMMAEKETKAIDINPNEQTIENIRIMVNRSISFWDKYGPIVIIGFKFGEKGYSKTVCAGDGDYLTFDTLWDFKTSKKEIQKNDTLQLLMYWIMGKHSGKLEFKNINKIGIYNPRLNIVYLYDVDNLSNEIIKKIEDEVICY